MSTDVPPARPRISCPTCGGVLVNERRRDVVYEVTGQFSTFAYLFPQVRCSRENRHLVESEWPEPLRARIRSFRTRYALLAAGLIVVCVFLYCAPALAERWPWR